MSHPVKRLLVVNDEILLINDVVKMFEAENEAFELFTALDGIKAIEVVQKESLDLVITDLVMPNMDGVELLRILQSEYPDLPVIVWDHGFGAPKMKEIVLQMGAAHYECFPLDWDTAYSNIKRVLAKENMTLARYLATLPPEDDEYWDDQIWDMTVALDLQSGTFGSLPQEEDTEKCIAYHLRGTEWGEEVWAKLRRERPELFKKI